MTDPLSATFSALADPTRRAILARLSLGETSVSELAEPFKISLPAVSRHLKVLEHAGLIARGREAQWRPCRLEPQALKSVDEWLEEYRRLWEQRLDRLENYLLTLTEPTSGETKPGGDTSGEKKQEKKRGRKK
jgi:DNA-binding transcriptional ArsR family regulator